MKKATAQDNSNINYLIRMQIFCGFPILEMEYVIRSWWCIYPKITDRHEDRIYIQGISELQNPQYGNIIPNACISCLLPVFDMPSQGLILTQCTRGSRCKGRIYDIHESIMGHCTLNTYYRFIQLHTKYALSFEEYLLRVCVVIEKKYNLDNFGNCDKLL